MDEFLILDVESSQRADMLLWWKPGGQGYTVRLAEAGRWSKAEIEARKLVYNNGEQTLAVPFDEANEHAIRIVPGGGSMLRELRNASEKVFPD